jgi:hypothetical protein
MQIDLRALELFTRQFLEGEMKEHNIKAVEINNFLFLLRKQPMCFDPSERKILIDLTIPPEELKRRMNHGDGSYRLYGHNMDLDLDECWAFCWFHEMAHADGTEAEHDCDFYARKKIREYRDRKENKKICCSMDQPPF